MGSVKAINAARLALRLTTLAAALDDLPGQAKRFARWKARGPMNERYVEAIRTSHGSLQKLMRAA